LGKPESEHFINPATARITWILKDKENIEKDYEHFSCPLVNVAEQIGIKIRNLKYRYIKSGTLFPDEVEQYDPYIIREALHNCIAHQDYSLGGKIVVVENEDGWLTFTNSGEFIPNSVEEVVTTDSPEEKYRNTFLVGAMVNLNMIDTIGSGIKKMFNIQRRKFFPLPEYDLSNNKVKVTITGKVVDINYARKLAEMPNLSLDEIILLDKVAKQKMLSDEEAKSLKPFDRYNLLGHVEIEALSIDDILNDDSGLLNSEGDTSIFDFKHTPKESSRLKADYIAQRKSLSEKDFAKYEIMFQQVHKELKEGKRKFAKFEDAERNLIEGNFYLVDGLLCYLEVSNAEQVVKQNKSGDRVRLEGRTVTIFENGTISNLLFRSLGKAILKNGKLVTNPAYRSEEDLMNSSGFVSEEDIKSGWIYVLKSKSENPEIKSVQNLYKIGFSTVPVKERIKNASKEATYLFDDVEIISSYKCYNLNTQNFESLVHRFFAVVCLNIDLYDKNGVRYMPREWFVAPIRVIDEVIHLIQNGNILDYKYDAKQQQLLLK